MLTPKNWTSMMKPLCCHGQRQCAFCLSHQMDNEQMNHEHFFFFLFSLDPFDFPSWFLMRPINFNAFYFVDFLCNQQQKYVSLRDKIIVGWHLWRLTESTKKLRSCVLATLWSLDDSVNGERISLNDYEIKSKIADKKCARNYTVGPVWFSFITLSSFIIFDFIFFTSSLSGECFRLFFFFGLLINGKKKVANHRRVVSNEKTAVFIHFLNAQTSFRSMRPTNCNRIALILTHFSKKKTCASRN